MRRKVVKAKGSTKRKRGRPEVDTAKTVKPMKREQPTDRADIFFSDEIFEKELEEVEFEVRGPLSAIRARIHAGPVSPGSLTFSGCLCLLVLYTTGAPEWAQLGGLILPWIIALSWVACRALARRGGGPEQG